MDPDRTVTLTDAALLAGCSRKSLERRVERGSLAVTHDAEGRRAVRIADLMRVGVVALVPAAAESGVDALRVAEAEGEADALRAALVATEGALRRARDEAQILRRRATDADARAAVAENELTRLLLGSAAEAIRQEPRRGRLRLRST